MACASSRQVRSKLFRRLGIPVPISSRAQVAPVADRGVRDLRRAPTFNEPLQYEYDHHAEKKVQRGKAEADLTRQRSVSFEEHVTVAPIPMRCEYSDRIKKKLWSSEAELQGKTERNLLEFAAEGFDWRNACPEDEMYVCPETNELIHPVHVELGQFACNN